MSTIEEDSLYSFITKTYSFFSEKEQGYLFHLIRLIHSYSLPYNSLGVAYILNPFLEGSKICQGTYIPTQTIHYWLVYQNVSIYTLDVSQYSSQSSDYKSEPFIGMDASKFFTKHKPWKMLKTEFIEKASTSKICAQCEEEKNGCLFSTQCRAVCMKCPKKRPVKEKAYTLGQWVQHTKNRLMKLNKQENPVEELNQIMEEFNDRKEDLKNAGMDVSQFSNMIDMYRMSIGA